MSSNQISLGAMGAAAVATMLLSALPVSALATSTASTAKAGANAVRLTTLIKKADTDISARIAALNDLDTRVQGLQKVSTTEKSAIDSQIQTNITGLTALQAKIDADTDLTTARTDAGTIFTTFRIYALVIPQGWILASADRVTTITGLLATLGSSIQTRISSAQASGKDVASLTAAMTDLSAKIADANTQEASAETGVATLVPDQGNKSTAASNHAALVTARGNIKTAATDILAARKDVTTLLQGLKALGGNAASSTTMH